MNPKPVIIKFGYIGYMPVENYHLFYAVCSDQKTVRVTVQEGYVRIDPLSQIWLLAEVYEDGVLELSKLKEFLSTWFDFDLNESPLNPDEHCEVCAQTQNNCRC